MPNEPKQVMANNSERHTIEIPRTEFSVVMEKQNKKRGVFMHRIVWQLADECRDCPHRETK
jgi:hypothetical protein